MNAPLIAVPDRTKFIGGSDVAAILGVSPWRNVVDLWMDKITPRREDGHNAAAKRRGSRLEPYILDMIREEHGLNIVAANERYIDAELPFLAAEIDAEYADGEARENIEIKTVHPFKSKEWGEHETDELPLHYVAQVQHGLPQGLPPAVPGGSHGMQPQAMAPQQPVHAYAAPAVPQRAGATFVTGAYQASGDPAIDRMLRLEAALKRFGSPI